MSDRPSAEEADEVDAPPAEPKPKKKRKKRATEERTRLEGQSEALDRLIVAFDAGNYAFVRREGPKLVSSEEDDDVRAAAADLVRRIDPDPMSKWMMAGAGLLLAFLAGWYWTHAHGGP